MGYPKERRDKRLEPGYIRLEAIVNKPPFYDRYISIPIKVKDAMFTQEQVLTRGEYKYFLSKNKFSVYKDEVLVKEELIDKQLSGLRRLLCDEPLPIFLGDRIRAYVSPIGVLIPVGMVHSTDEKNLGPETLEVINNNGKVKAVYCLRRFDPVKATEEPPRRMISHPHRRSDGTWTIISHPY